VVLQEAYYGRPVLVADRELVESGADTILAGAETEDIAVLVVGDPFGCGLQSLSLSLTKPQ
jgi:diphthine methyl ester synthase